MLSFIIPAHNEEALIGPTVAAVLTAARAVGEPFEVLVVNDASTDHTAEVAQAAGARVVRVEKRQIAAVRNAGAKESRGDILMFIDADTLLPETTLRAALAALRGNAVGGGALVRMDQKLGVAHALMMGGWNLASRLCRYAAGCFVFARRDAFEAVGGFDERFYASEEIFLSRALKTRGRFVILRQRVITSGRKLRMYGTWELFSMSLGLLLKGPRAWQKREGLGLWYDGRRESGR